MGKEKAGASGYRRMDDRVYLRRRGYRKNDVITQRMNILFFVSGMPSQGKVSSACIPILFDYSIFYMLPRWKSDYFLPDISEKRLFFIL